MFAYFSMVVPTNTTVILQINSADVVHSWWIPALGGKADGVPAALIRGYSVPAWDGSARELVMPPERDLFT